MLIAYARKHQRGRAISHSNVCEKRTVLNFVAQNPIFQGKGRNSAKSSW